MMLYASDCAAIARRCSALIRGTLRPVACSLGPAQIVDDRGGEGEGKGERAVAKAGVGGGGEREGVEGDSKTGATPGVESGTENSKGVLWEAMDEAERACQSLWMFGKGVARSEVSRQRARLMGILDATGGIAEAHRPRVAARVRAAVDECLGVMMEVGAGWGRALPGGVLSESTGALLEGVCARVCQEILEMAGESDR